MRVVCLLRAPRKQGRHLRDAHGIQPGPPPGKDPSGLEKPTLDRVEQELRDDEPRGRGVRVCLIEVVADHLPAVLVHNSAVGVVDHRERHALRVDGHDKENLGNLFRNQRKVDSDDFIISVPLTSGVIAAMKYPTLLAILVVHGPNVPPVPVEKDGGNVEVDVPGQGLRGEDVPAHAHVNLLQAPDVARRAPLQPQAGDAGHLAEGSPLRGARGLECVRLERLGCILGLVILRLPLWTLGLLCKLNLQLAW
mmetsp:Transcript_20021/g.55084  ORF Transcript_20021/g.55084 Transcript_20021/m.55084 type:complete len:251 (-) Transcript_20021:1169-1921(-)